MRRVGLLVTALVVAGCGGGNIDSPAQRTASVDPAAHHERGRAIYNFRCYFCHGYSGDAKTLATTYLQPAPRDFTALTRGDLTRERAIEAIRRGRPGTAMKSFAGIIDDADIAAVADFVLAEFVKEKRPNTRYHTAENGWPDHQRFRIAFPFATGEMALDTPWEALDEAGNAGKRLFLTACISCHDRAKVADAGPAWDPRPVSYPPDGHDCTSCHDRSRYADRGPPAASKPVSYHRSADIALDHKSVSARDAETYGKHDIPPAIAGLSAQEREGAHLYLRNCAFCHAADGTGKNWIGQFLEPHPRDLTSPAAMRGMTRETLATRIREGLPGTSMPTWEKVLSPAQIDAIVAYISRAFQPIAESRQ